MENGKPRPKLRHIAICVDDLEASRRFYEDVFGLEVADRGSVNGADYMFMTDGDFSLALLNFTTEQAARVFNVDGGAAYVGLDHIGFLHSDPQKLLRRLEGSDVRVINDDPHQMLDELEGGPVDDDPLEYGMNFEYKVVDPNGVRIDVAPSWPGLVSQA